MEQKWNDSLSNNTSDPSRASQRVFVGNLKPHIMRVDIFEIFSKYGEITAISVNRQGYGFVQYSDDAAAQQALTENGAQIKSCTLQVKPCSVNDARKKRKDRSRSRSPGNATQRRRSSSRSPPPSSRRSPSPGSSRGRSGQRGPRTESGYSREGPVGHYRTGDGSGPLRGDNGGYRGAGDPSVGYSRSESHKGRSPPRGRGSSQYGPSHSRGPPLDAPRKPNDCEIVVMSKQQRDYAENVERRLKNLGLKVDVLFLKDEALLAQALDDLGLRGTLYACVIGEQHEVHNSVTLNVLYGVPQEHRNMPVDEALKFLSQNFREHLERQRDRDVAEDEREVKFLLKLLIESRYISVREYDLLIQHLTAKRDQLIQEESGDGRRAQSPHRDPPPSHAMALGRPEASHRLHEPQPSLLSQAMTIEQQNQQLHEKIRNLIGTPSSGLAPAAAPVLGAGVGIGSQVAPPLQAPPTPFGLAGNLGVMNAQAPPSQAPFVNLSNPSVQEALDKLLKQGALGTQLAMGIPDDPRNRRDAMGGGVDKEPFPPSRGSQGVYGGGPFEGYGNGGNSGGYGTGGYLGGAGGYATNYENSRERSPPRGHYGGGDGRRY